MDNEVLSIPEFRALTEEQQCSKEVLAKMPTDILMSLLSEYVISDAVDKAIRTEINERDPDILAKLAEDSEKDSFSVENSKKYKMLRFVRDSFYFSAALNIILGIFGFVYFLAEQETIEAILCLYFGQAGLLICFSVYTLFDLLGDLSSSSNRILKFLETYLKK
ncbi:MAG: hypothetical protein GYA77_08805 [Candidatus Cloacimonetes bacterium]|nr:hypothetical protein [Candidatus Cloacimonadota bacterium]